MTKNSFEGKKFKASFKINVPAKLNKDLEKELNKQLGVTFDNESNKDSTGKK